MKKLKETETTKRILSFMIIKLPKKMKLIVKGLRNMGYKIVRNEEVFYPTKYDLDCKKNEVFH